MEVLELTGYYVPLCYCNIPGLLTRLVLACVFRGIQRGGREVSNGIWN